MSYQSTILAEASLVSYYQFDESAGAGSAADSKGTNTGTNNSVTTGMVSSPSLNNCYSFNGSASYVSIPRSIQDDFSIEFLFKTSSGAPSGSHYYEGWGLVNAEVGGVTNDFGLSLCNNGTNRIHAGTGNPDIQLISTAGVNLSDGAWHHVVFTRLKSSGACVLYIDGASVATGTGNTVSLTAPSAINIGRILTGGGYFNGTMDEVALYSAALSSGSVAAHIAALPVGNARLTMLGEDAVLTGPTTPRVRLTMLGEDAILTGIATPRERLTRLSIEKVLVPGVFVVTQNLVTTVALETVLKLPAPTYRGHIEFDQVRDTARKGAGSQFQMFGGGVTQPGHVPVYNADGSIIDAGFPLGVLSIRVVSVNTTMTNADYTVVAIVPSLTITLPPTPALGQIANVKNGNATTGQLITVSAGTAAIDVSSTVSLGATASLTTQWDGTQWRIL